MHLTATKCLGHFGDWGIKKDGFSIDGESLQTTVDLVDSLWAMWNNRTTSILFL